jgi:hypothetical protein
MSPRGRSSRRRLRPSEPVNCHVGRGDERGRGDACSARVAAGGASNRKLIIKLTDTNLRLLSVAAVSSSSSGAYLLTGRRFALGGSEYRVTLNAVKANPQGSHLVMRFRTVT